MRFDRAILLGLIALLLVISVHLLLPYLQFILGALFLAFVLRPLQKRLAPRIGGTPAAGVLVFLSAVAVVLPLLVIFFLFADDAMQWVETLQDADLHVAGIEQMIEGATGRDIDLAAQLTGILESAAETAFSGVLTTLETAVHLLIGIGLLLFLLFYFIRDWERLGTWMRDVVPLPPRVAEDLIERISAITRAVLIGHVLVAIIQGGIAGLGLAVVGIPNAIFWTFVMILLALIPLIGTFLVWAPASAYLYLEGEIGLAIALFVYGTIVVGISDEYLRPIVVDRFARISPSVIIVGVIGGMSVLGFMGLFVGPIIVGALKQSIEVYDEYYGGQFTSPPQ